MGKTWTIGFQFLTFGSFEVERVNIFVLASCLPKSYPTVAAIYLYIGTYTFVVDLVREKVFSICDCSSENLHYYICFSAPILVPSIIFNMEQRHGYNMLQ